jgi:hypothetical protein
MVGPLGYCQQLAGLPGKAFLGESRELGQVVVGDQRFVLFGGFASIDKLLPLQLIDVDTDPALQGRYGLAVPVLAVAARGEPSCAPGGPALS